MRASHVVFLLAAGLAGVGAYVAHGNGMLPALAAASKGADHAAAAPDAKGGTSERRGAPKVAVVTATARAEPLLIRRRTIGAVESPAVVAIKPRINGTVTELITAPGQDVKAGDLIVKLDPRDLQAALEKDQAMQAKDEAARERTAADAERARQLLAKNAGSQQAADQAEADAKAAAATVEADKATVEADRLQLSYTEIRAPIDGRLGAVNVAVGTQVSTSDSAQPIVTVTELSPARVTFVLPERDLDLVRAALPSKPDVAIYRRGSTTPVAHGTLTFIDSAVDAASGTVKLKADVANTDLALWPGQAVEVEIVIGRHDGTVVVPNVAVQQGQDRPFVFAVESGVAKVRAVTLAGTDGEEAGVTDGLKAGDKVVVEGQAQLAEGSAVVERQDKAAAADTRAAGGVAAEAVR